jgi:hypothetical protein
LLASVAAAEAALRAATAKQQQQAASRPGGAGSSGFAAAAGVLDVTDEGSDSDGGWGVSREVSRQLVAQRCK